MYTSHSSRLGVLSFWFDERVAVGASPCLKRRAYGRNNSQHCWPENVGSCWIVQTNSTTPNNVGTSSALCHNIYKLKEFKRQYCDTREWSSRRPCVMRGRGTENFWTALQTDPHIVALRWLAITDQRNVESCWPNFAPQHAATYNRVCKRTPTNDSQQCWELLAINVPSVCFKCSTVDGTIHFYSNTVKTAWEMAKWPLYTGWPLYSGQLCIKYKATENFGKFVRGPWYTGYNNNNNNFILSTKIQSWIVWPLYTGPLYTGLTEIQQMSVEIKFLSGR